MAKVKVPLGIKIRVFILTLLGALFFFPSLVLVVNAFLQPDITADDPLAMLVVGSLLGFCGLLIWWVGGNMYSKARRGAKIKSDMDMTAIGLAHMHHIADMSDGYDGSDDFGDFDGGGE